MTIQTYQDLQASVAQWLNRTDLAAVIPDFITIAESRMAMVLRTRQMVKPVTLTQLAGTASVALPTDWLEWDALYMSGNDEALEYVTYRQWSDDLDTNNYSTNIATYTMDGSLLYTVGAIPTGQPTVTLNATYYARMVPVATASTSSDLWLLTSHPETYLYGALVSGWQYLLDEQRAAANGGLFDAAVQTLNAKNAKALHSGSMWRQRPR